MRAHVALATYARLPSLDEDWPPLRAALEAEGVVGEPAVWDDPAVEWGCYNLVVVRATWDYARRSEEFLRWAEKVAAVSRLANALEILRWNTDKRYLADLEAAGLPVVPTKFVGPAEEVHLPSDEYVLKPSVSAGARDTARYGPAEVAQARRHIAELLAAGRTVMVQPYVPSVDARGETSLVYLNGTYSHAVRRGPILLRGAGTTRRPSTTNVRPRVPTAAERSTSDAALAAVMDRFGTPLYARVDLVESQDGHSLILELELTEPTLFLRHNSFAPSRLAQAIARSVSQARHS